MREVPDLSYTQLVQAAAQRKQSKAGQAVQTPDVEGPMADTPVFGGDATGVSRIAVAGQTLMAGLLDDVTANSTLDVSSADPTHRVVWMGDRLALVGRDGVLDGQGAGASPRLGAGDTDVLATRLTQVAGRIRLERALAQLRQGSRIGGFSLPSSKPGAAFKLQTGETGPQRRCAKPSGPRVDAKGKATASHCDMLQVTLKNPTAGMVDMTVLYIDADSAISMLWPSQDLSNRLESGAKATRAAEAEQADSAGRVIGGEIADSDAWPSQVALLIAGQPVTPDAQFCGGSMILDTWVLTAAHCIHMADANGVYRDLNPQAIAVLIGTNLLAEGQGDAISVEKIIRHSEYVGGDFDNDIALIKLSRAPTVPFKTIQVPDAEFGDQLDTPGVRTIVTGWGLIEGAQRTAEMRQAEIQMLSRENCNEVMLDSRAKAASEGIAYAASAFGLKQPETEAVWQELISHMRAPMTENMLCSGTFEGGKGSCSGDSGAPLVVPLKNGEFIQAGGVSWGLSNTSTKSCLETAQFAAYTRVSNYLGWLEQMIASN